jgi:hypothetical protein
MTAAQARRAAGMDALRPGSCARTTASTSSRRLRDGYALLRMSTVDGDGVHPLVAAGASADYLNWSETREVFAATRNGSRDLGERTAPLAPNLS